jgi:hypothetical protein
MTGAIIVNGGAVDNTTCNLNASSLNTSHPEQLATAASRAITAVAGRKESNDGGLHFNHDTTEVNDSQRDVQQQIIHEQSGMAKDSGLNNNFPMSLPSITGGLNLSQRESQSNSFKTSANNSLGTWQSEKKRESDDSDSDMEVWTNPAPVAPSTNSLLPQTPNQLPQARPIIGAAAAAVPTPSSMTSTTGASTNNFIPSSLHQLINNTPSNNYASSFLYNSNNIPQPLALPPNHIPTWDNILPPNFFVNLLNNTYNTPQRKRIVLSLINVWEFTLEGEVNRIQIKKIAKDHIGKDGRRGALFERGGIALPEDPALKSITASEEGYRGGGKWHIPLGAYHALMTYLTSDSTNVVEGIPTEQLRAATLGRERFEKDFPSAEELVKRGVAKSVAYALAPYQRGGVDFILEKEGRALLADEMGLGEFL